MSAPRRPLLIGITGPIGCGKSTVAAMLAELGGTIIDADRLTRQVTDGDSAVLAEIRERFGAVVFHADGSLDREKLADIVFRDYWSLSDLEGIIHPRVNKLVEDAVQAATRAEAPFIVVEAIKLVESRLSDGCDEIWMIRCRPETQLTRLIERGEDRDDANRRIGIQGTQMVDRLAAELATRRGNWQVRYLSTDATMEDVRERVENTLAEAFDVRRD